MDTTFNCAGCGTQIQAEANSLSAICPKCGRMIDLSGSADQVTLTGKITGPVILERRYIILRGISVLLKAASVILVFIGLFHLVRFMANAQDIDLMVQRELYLAGISILTALGAWGYAELIMVFIDTEENTRAMRQLMERQ
jgi:hypothetical protein